MPKQEYIYTFILGRNVALSVAEILSVLTREHFVFVILSISAKALIIKTPQEIKNAQRFLDRLGGSIKIAEILTKINNKKDIKETLLRFIENACPKTKFVWGVSLHDFDDMSINQINHLGFEIKNDLRKMGVSSRFIRLNDLPYLSAPEITNNKVMGKGMEFILIRMGGNIFVGKTVAIQDFQSYSFRDYERPKRNPKSGMLPPKLAQIMINLVPNHKYIYDPFCGNGTILAEAMLMEGKAIGSDLSSKAVSDTKENLCWLINKYDLEATIDPDKEIFQSDATDIQKKQLPQEPDCIVSEIYLGPPLTKAPHKEELYETTSRIEGVSLGFLKNTHSNLACVKYLVIAMPFYKLKDGDYKLNIIDQIKNIGYTTISPLENSKINFGLMPEYNKERKTFLYSRESQIVGREIIILERR